MRNTTNRIQRQYMVAKAAVDALEAEEKRIDHQFIVEHGIRNLDGSTPEYVWCMDNDAAFESANLELSKIETASGLQSQINAAHDVLREAEDRLIAYGLSLAPNHERDVLSAEVKKNSSVRQKVLDLAFKLDVSTVPR